MQARFIYTDGVEISLGVHEIDIILGGLEAALAALPHNNETLCDRVELTAAISFFKALTEGIIASREEADRNDHE